MTDIDMQDNEIIPTISIYLFSGSYQEGSTITITSSGSKSAMKNEVLFQADRAFEKIVSRFNSDIQKAHI
jgi:hypothetical protein